MKQINQKTYARLDVGLQITTEQIPISKTMNRKNQYDIPDCSNISFTDYLKGQIRYNDLTASEQDLLSYIIDLLDTDTGFFNNTSQGDFLSYRC